MAIWIVSGLLLMVFAAMMGMLCAASRDGDDWSDYE